jgi:hypothetical protein
VTVQTETINKRRHTRVFTRAEVEQLLVRAVLDEAKSEATADCVEYEVQITTAVDAAAPETPLLQQAVLVVVEDTTPPV